MRPLHAWALWFATGIMECKNGCPPPHYILRITIVDLMLLGFYIMYTMCRTSICHMDFPGVVDKGLIQMLSLVADQEAILDVCFFLFYCLAICIAVFLCTWEVLLLQELNTQWAFELQVHVVGAFNDASNEVWLLITWLGPFLKNCFKRMIS